MSASLLVVAWCQGSQRFGARRGRDAFARARHAGAEAGNVPAGQQYVPVELLEAELAEMVQPGLFQQRQTGPAREPAGNRLGVVVVVDEQRLAVPAFDEAVGVAIEAGTQRPPVEEAADVADQGLALEVGDRAGLGRPDVGGVADDEYVRAGLGLERPLVARHEPERVPKTRR